MSRGRDGGPLLGAEAQGASSFVSLSAAVGLGLCGTSGSFISEARTGCARGWSFFQVTAI